MDKNGNGELFVSIMSPIELSAIYAWESNIRSPTRIHSSVLIWDLPIGDYAYLGTIYLLNNPDPGNLGYYLDGKSLFFGLIADNARERTFAESIL
jgi:hypothetical protein